MPPRSKPTPKPQPSDPRVVTIQDVEYFIEWSQVPVGASFFLPTTALPEQVEAALKPVAMKLDYGFKVAARCEYGRYGARVWRVY